MSSPKHQVWTEYGTVVGSDSPRSSRSIKRPGQESRGAASLGLFLELGPAGRRFERELDLAEPGLDSAGQGGERRLDQAVDLAAGGQPVLLGVVEVAPGLGIGVGPAADDGQRDRARRLLLDLVAGVTGPIGADLVEFASQGRAVAGVAEEHGPHLAGRVGRAQHRQAVVDGPVGIDAEIDPAAVLQDPPVGREADPSLAPRQARRRAGRQGRERDLLDRVGQLAGIAVDPRFLVGRHRIAEDEVQPAAQGRAAVRVRRADDEPLSLAGPTFFFSRAATSSVTFAPTAQLSTATSTAGPPSAVVVAADRQRPGLEPAGDPLRLRLARCRSPPSGSDNPA